ncbi:hypothetical protein [Anatilimnocola floriformis]|uniref:hypothetical protein n=1 Tax=Anatilimnocola floriformis TaxID=2948575 RepID=UPI0020C3BB15|nr:hypothetical protein [Anatilimnocola floriformis]
MRWQSGFAATLLVSFASLALAAEALPEIRTETPLKWQDNYLDATEAARDAKQILLVWFADEKQEPANEKFAASVLNQADVAPLLAGMTLVKVNTSTEIESKGKTFKLIEHSTMKELLGGPGLVMIDFRDAEQKVFGHVVTVYPFQHGPITAAKLKVLCELPTGTLTQRTLMFAVRTHPAKPASAWSPHSDYLAKEAEKHSQHQASINLQGHHNWEARFHQINAGLGIGGAKEVCAESWPGQNLLDAAEECVHSWSQSPGHWAGVSARHSYFGYDMKRGTNGVWYATGIFGGR